MALPTTYRAFRRTEGDLPHTIKLSEETLPQNIGSHDVLIKIHAVSLNYRDVAMLNGKYPVEVEDRGMPASDCAAEVVAVGSEVTNFKKGDHVAPIFNLSVLTGHEDDAMRALGGDVPGVLREYAVFDDSVLVHLPPHLSWEEASTLTCAGVTAWSALNWPQSLESTRSVLLQGTGGVSLFALILCEAADITSIITSSSDEKIANLKKAWSKVEGINYKTSPDQESEVARLTNGRGVDVVVNNTGVGSLITDLKSLRQRGGVVSLVGFLAGLDGQWNPSELMSIMYKTAILKGIAVGSKIDYERMNQFLSERKVSLEPVIDKVFSFEQSPEAFDYLYSGKHVGKVVIKL
ncbi:Zinc-type alcohol dehydrogenase-like protein [Cercospora beticola]|uniref:Zinc-type alcohol dehydrogenase-like protein n=1 Tax=Cercospora beticola TaxID=122368 RepID=A0A2G5HKN1_CERBT|nr:Zinc-type alcohol dehydrogenase-like protein [Cercospora beticola]PIA93075.1 Zinc-type alcohol dehydrogenase-like protein [Cercospora beticola]WPB02332.1 hypothetical protein RHO25_006966 [Cercospora beticola]CAK1362788.1 unnamed protein product [Cercospora beticola]